MRTPSIPNGVTEDPVYSHSGAVGALVQIRRCVGRWTPAPRNAINPKRGHGGSRLFTQRRCRPCTNPALCRTMDSGTAKPVYLGYARHCDAQGAGAVCGDRAPAARRLVDGAYAVVLSETEQGSGFGEISEYSSITSDFPFTRSQGCSGRPGRYGLSVRPA